MDFDGPNTFVLLAAHIDIGTRALKGANNDTGNNTGRFMNVDEGVASGSATMVLHFFVGLVAFSALD